MKKNLMKILSILMLSVLLISCIGCNDDQPADSQTEKKGAECAKTSAEFDLQNSSDISFSIKLNNDKFQNLEKDSKDIGKENYAFASGVLTIHSGYLSNYKKGEIIKLVAHFEISELNVEIKVIQSERPLPTAEELMIDDYYGTGDHNGKNTVDEPDDDVWKNLNSVRKPLGLGESFTEDFSKDYHNSRLYPYIDDAYTAEREYIADFEILNEGENKGCKIFCEPDNPYNRDKSWASVLFKGQQFTEKASYVVEVQYTVLTENAQFQLCFADNANKVADLRGEINVRKTVKGNFTADTKNGYNANVKAFLFVTFGGGATDTQIIIHSLKLTRVNCLEKVNGSIVNDFDENRQIGVNPTLNSVLEEVDGTEYGFGETNVLKVKNKAGSRHSGILLNNFLIKSGTFCAVSFKIRIEILSEENLRGAFTVKIKGSGGNYEFKMPIDKLKADKVNEYTSDIIFVSSDSIEIEIFDWSGPENYNMYFDDIKIKTVKNPECNAPATDLFAAGSTVFDDFEGNQRNISFDQGSPSIFSKAVDNSKIGESFGNAVAVNFNGEGGWIFNSFKNYKLNKGIYTVEFDYKVLKADDKIGNMFVFMRFTANMPYLNKFVRLDISQVSTEVLKFKQDIEVLNNNEGWFLQIGNNNKAINANVLIDNLRITKKADPK